MVPNGMIIVRTLRELVLRGGALAVPIVTAYPSTTSVPTAYYSIWH